MGSLENWKRMEGLYVEDIPFSITEVTSRILYGASAEAEIWGNNYWACCMLHNAFDKVRFAFFTVKGGIALE